MTTRKLQGPLGGDYQTDGAGNAVLLNSYPLTGEDDIPTRLADHEARVTAAEGRTTLAVYDDFSRYADGNVAGLVPMLGDAWAVTGGVTSVISDGRATGASSGTHYMAQTLDDTPVYMTCDVSFAGTDASSKPMTMAFCRAPVTDAEFLYHFVHFNFGPTAATVTIRQDGGSFITILSGVWRKPVPLDGTVAQFGLAVNGENVVIIGPNGETFAVRDYRVPAALDGGTTVFWEPIIVNTEQAFLHACSVHSRASTGYVAAPVLPDGLAAIARIAGANGQTRGNPGEAQEAWIGLDPSTLMPGMGLGAQTIRTRLLEDVAVGASTIKTDQKIPAGSSLLIGSASSTDSETVTQNASFASGSAPPFTSTLTGTTAKAHVAGDAVTATPPSTQRVYLYLNTQNGRVRMFDAPIIFPNSAGLYFNDALDTRLYSPSANLLAMGSGDSFFLDGTYNGGHLQMGSYHLWIDGSGNLRVKSSAPTSATDGTVVGSQS